MVEERSLTDAELDAALAEALAEGPSSDFVARVRERLATEDLAGRPSLPFVAAVVTLTITAIVFAIVLERRPTPVQTSVRTAGTADSETGTPATLAATPERIAKAAQRSAKPRLERPVRQEPQNGRDQVLIPSDEQQALRRLLERPPSAVLGFAPKVDATDVAAIAIPPLSIDPLSSEVEEGGHQ
jgi:hypothetical protein